MLTLSGRIQLKFYDVLHWLYKQCNEQNHDILLYFTSHMCIDRKIMDIMIKY